MLSREGCRADGNIVESMLSTRSRECVVDCSGAGEVGGGDDIGGGGGEGDDRGGISCGSTGVSVALLLVGRGWTIISHFVTLEDL